MKYLKLFLVPKKISLDKQKKRKMSLYQLDEEAENLCPPINNKKSPKEYFAAAAGFLKSGSKIKKFKFQTSLFSRRSKKTK